MKAFGLVAAAGVGALGGYAAAQRLARGSSNGTDAQSVERIVHIARIRSGSEGDLRRLVTERFPTEELAAAGIRKASVFIGSTYLLTEYAFDGEYTPTFTALRGNPRVNAFLEEIGAHLDDEPAPLPDAPAMQMLASQALHWERDGQTAYTPRVRPKEASRDRQ